MQSHNLSMTVWVSERGRENENNNIKRDTEAWLIASWLTVRTNIMAKSLCHNCLNNEMALLAFAPFEKRASNFPPKPISLESRNDPDDSRIIARPSTFCACLPTTTLWCVSHRAMGYDEVDDPSEDNDNDSERSFQPRSFSVWNVLSHLNLIFQLKYSLGFWSISAMSLRKTPNMDGKMFLTIWRITNKKAIKLNGR